MEVELRERRSGSANETPRLQGLKILRSGGTKVRTIEARVTYQNIRKMAWGSEPGVVTRMVLECSRSVRRWSRVSEVGVEVHGYDTHVICPDSVFPSVPLYSVEAVYSMDGYIH